jgi:uncharacterized protein (TIGR03546 family)
MAMLLLLRMVQSLIRTLHSEGTPHQVAVGITLGAALGLTPLLSLHNLFVVAVIMLFNVSVGGAGLGFLAFTPLGFALDPLFEALGAWLLEIGVLHGLWTTLYNLPVLPLSNFNNTVVLGSIVAWVCLTIPIYAGSRAGVARYRATIGAKVRKSKWYKTIAASRVMSVYRLVRPE